MTRRRTVSFISLGCPKNLVDSEGLISTLLSRGFRVLTEPADADLVVVNTCGFLSAARKESIQAIREAVSLKERGVRGVLVAGCMVGNYRDQLEAEAPGVDRFVPFVDYRQIDRIADSILPPETGPSFALDRRRMDAALTPSHYAYLKISEGCNHTCSFCVIPDIRGAMRSVPEADLAARAEAMAARGVKELTLIAQDSTVYGTDIYGENRTASLLRRLDRVEGIRWIRLMYAYPTEVRDDLMDAIAGGERVLPYLDVPVQHASTPVLKRMRRGYDRRRLEEMVAALRSRIPGIALRTTVIVGFPGETDADFDELIEFVSEQRFDRLGAFQYSQEEGSRAAGLPGQIPEDVKAGRYARLMEVQQSIAFQHAQARIGREELVLIDAPAEEGRPALGRTMADAPEVDATVAVHGTQAGPGEFAKVLITGSSGYDLTGHARGDPDG